MSQRICHKKIVPHIKTIAEKWMNPQTSSNPSFQIVWYWFKVTFCNSLWNTNYTQRSQNVINPLYDPRKKIFLLLTLKHCMFNLFEGKQYFTLVQTGNVWLQKGTAGLTECLMNVMTQCKIFCKTCNVVQQQTKKKKKKKHTHAQVQVPCKCLCCVLLINQMSVYCSSKFFVVFQPKIKDIRQR